MLIYIQMLESDEDKSKFEQIYLHYRDRMFYVANNILHNENDAEDAVHQAFLAIIMNLSKITDIKCPQTQAYIVVIVEHKAIDIIRERKHEIAAELDESLYGISVPLPGDHGLADALAKLPARYREVLLLHFDSGYKTKEVAEMLGLSQSAVQKLVWRAKIALQKLLEEGDENVGR